MLVKKNKIMAQFIKTKAGNGPYSIVYLNVNAIATVRVDNSRQGEKLDESICHVRMINEAEDRKLWITSAEFEQLIDRLNSGASNVETIENLNTEPDVTD